MSTWEQALCGEAVVEGRCFRSIVWTLPTYFLLTFICAFYIGKHYKQKCKFFLQHEVIRMRIIISVFLLFVPTVKLILIHSVSHSQLYIIDYSIAFIESLCWLSLIVYLCTLRPVNIQIEWQINVNFGFVLCFIQSVFNLYYIINSINDQPIERYAEIFKLVASAVYIFTLIFRINYSFPLHSEFRRLSAVNSEGDALLNSSSSMTYGGFREDADPFALGTAEESGPISKIFLWWVKPLMKKGDLNLIHTSEDLFDLPDSLLASNVHFKFRVSKKLSSEQSLLLHDDPSEYDTNAISLLQRFHQCFGVEYYSLGILKLAADCLSFAGPVLLNLIVGFLENDKENSVKLGYYYAAALLATTFVGALCSTHYNYLVSRISLKVRAALICAIYQKTLNVSQSLLSKFTTGEIVNFMSTDTDRIINFCTSFHQFWSLPVQVALALFLLYKEIGFSFLVGLAFAILMIPLNQYIAKKIGKYSTFMMKEKDKRIKLVSEILNGVRVVKMHAWEDAFSEKIDSIRQEEIKYLKKRKYLDAFCVYFWATTPVIISFLSFTVYALLGNALTASRIFTSITLFNILIVPLNAFPWVLNGLVEAHISLNRVEGLLKLPELSLNKYYSEPADGNIKLEIVDGVFTHSIPKDKNPSEFEVGEENLNGEKRVEVFHLGPINFTVPQGKFVCIVGRVGCGKSTLLSSILGDIPRVSGAVKLSISDWSFGIGFIPQEPWIQQTSIRENILFGKPMNTLHYRNVLEACALFDDLKILPQGDGTEVGERGITLSGGQKARIALARAVYQGVGLLLLDDPLAAVDTHVADHIFNNCILGLLKNKTRIMCTHRLNVLEKADIIIVLDEGRISKQGPAGSISQFNYFLPNEKEQDNSLDSIQEDPFIENQLSVEVFGGNQLVQNEEKDSGVVKLHVYKSYWTSVGSSLALAVLSSCFFMQASKTLSDWWLSYWISHSSNNASFHYNNSESIHYYATGIIENMQRNDITYYLAIYGGLAAANTVFTLFRAFLFAYSGIKAATTLHLKLKNHIIKATLNFFCETPLGRILNRFSSDVYNVDDSLPFMLNILLAQMYSLVGCLVVTVYSLPFILIILVPLAMIYYGLQRYYRHTSRELKRISSITLSPIYAHFSETLNGLLTIRALAAVPRFEQNNILKLDANQQSMLATFAASQWLNLRLQLMGVVFVSGIAFIALLQNQFSTIEPALVGLALSYALTVTGLLNGFVTAFTETEKEMVSVERVMQYIEGVPLESEECLIEAPYSWPSHGIVTFKDVCLQYESRGSYALQYITFETKRAEKLGIVGRTGSGKSSLIQALFRMVGINYGQILIDGVDISKLCLKTLRSHLSVVPQDPFLFSGTVRENMDPYGTYSDSDIWRALQNCHMNEKIKDLGGLEAEVEEKGCNFSAGERQLLCLSRTLLHKAKILCLDEATASIDHQTDSLVQLAIRMAFRHTTILIIAHRIETVMNCDRVMVMGGGQILELDKPSVLLADSSSEFYGLVYGHQSSIWSS